MGADTIDSKSRVLEWRVCRIRLAKARNYTDLRLRWVWEVGGELTVLLHSSHTLVNPPAPTHSPFQLFVKAP